MEPSSFVMKLLRVFQCAVKKDKMSQANVEIFLCTLHSHVSKVEVKSMLFLQLICPIFIQFELFLFISFAQINGLPCKYKYVYHS